MDGHRFDELTKAFSRVATRRRLLGGLAGVVGAGLAARGLGVGRAAPGAKGSGPDPCAAFCADVPGARGAQCRQACKACGGPTSPGFCEGSANGTPTYTCCATATSCVQGTCCPTGTRTTCFQSSTSRLCCPAGDCCFDQSTGTQFCCAGTCCTDISKGGDICCPAGETCVSNTPATCCPSNVSFCSTNQGVVCCSGLTGCCFDPTVNDTVCCNDVATPPA